MKKHILGISLLLLLTVSANAQEINWLTLEQAEVEMKKNPEKPLFIDFYTKWCGWCKKMDASTFKEAEVVKHISDSYIPVKFDAESKEQVKFRGKTYKYVRHQEGGRGVNSFAYFSLRGKLSYPAYAVINSKGNLEKLLLGYMPKAQLLENLEQ